MNHNLEMYVVAIKSDKDIECKNRILDYFNNNVSCDDIKILYTFKCNIQKCVEQDNAGGKQDIKMVSNIMNMEQNNIYICNPTFSVSRSCITEKL